MSETTTSPTLRRLPVRPPVPPELLAREEKTLRKALVASKWNLSRTGAEMGRTASDVYRMLRRFPELEKERQASREGARKSGRKSVISSPHQLRGVMRAAGWDLEKAAEALGASKRTVRDALVRCALEDTYRRVREKGAS